MGETGSKRRWHRCATAVVATLVVAATLGGPVVTAVYSPAGAAGGSCAPADLKPNLVGQELMVSQGLPSYTNLVRGKDSLIRLFLSKPECASKSQGITVTGISLSVANGTTPLGTGQTFSPTGSFALPAYYTGPAVANSPTDPILTVKGNVLTPCGAGASCPTDTAGFNATFKATVSYTASGVTGTQTVTFETTKAVAQKSNALRLLVVPMGDANQLSSTQFTTAADAAVQQGMNTLSRILPVPCNADPADSTGACFATSLLSPYGGVRYSVSPATLDLRAVPGAYDTSGKFCGTQSNWEAVKGTLAQFLESWNTANPDTPADRVVGVVDEAISSGVGTSPSGFSCADGMAATGSVAAWVRAMYTTQPSRTGGLLAMEVTHTLGGVPFPRSFTTHSANSAADGTAPGRAYDLIRRAHIAVSRSAMKYDTTSPWTNDTTLFEKLDQELFLCHLGGPPTSECATSGTTGAVTGAGAGITVVVTGTTGFTPETTSVVMSYTADDVPQPEPPDPAAPDPTSSTRLIITGGANTGNLGVNTSTGQSDHDHSSGDEHGANNKAILNIAFEGIPGMTAFALYHCPTGTQACKDDPAANGGVLLYEAHKQPSRTTISNVTILPSGEPENWTQDPSRDDTNPAVHTGAVAWVARCSSCSSGVTTIHIAPQADRTKLVEIPINASGHAQVDPAWRVDGAQIAWVANGDIWKATVNRGTQPYTVGTPTKVYSQGTSNPAASYVSWSTDSSRLYFGATNGGIRHVPVNGGNSSPLVSTSAKEAQPATGPDGKVLVFVKKVTNGTDIWTVDPTKPNNTQRLLATNGDQPWYGADGKVLFRRDGKIMSVAVTGGAVTQVSTGPDDQNPTSSTPTLGFDRPFGSDREVVLANQNERTVIAQVSGPLNPNTKGELRLTCPDGSVFALAVGVEVDQQTATEGIVRATYDESRACGGAGTLQWICTDGFELCLQGASSTLTVINSTKPPVATITSPSTGTVIGPSSKLAINGSGSSAQGPLTGNALKWFVSAAGLPEQQVGTGNQFDLSPLGGAWPSGELTVRLQATAGSQTHSDFEVVIVDATPPSASIVSGPPPFTSSSTATFSFTFGDTGGSDAVTVYCQLDGGQKVECSSPVTYENLTPGEHEFTLVVVDEAGNVTVKTHTFIVDPFAPTTVATQSPPPNANGWNKTNVTVSFAATDPSGVQSITYALSGAQTGGATVPGDSASVTITAEGTTTIAYYATDNVPQVEATKYLVVNIDKTAPALAVSGGPTLVCSVLLGVLVGGCEYEGTAGDGRSGVAAVEVTLNGSTENAVCVGCGTGATNVTWSYAKSNLGLGTYNISFRSIDVAGNLSPPQSGTLTIQLL